MQGSAGCSYGLGSLGQEPSGHGGRPVFALLFSLSSVRVSVSSSRYTRNAPVKWNASPASIAGRKTQATIQEYESLADSFTRVFAACPKKVKIPSSQSQIRNSPADQMQKCKDRSPCSK